MNISEALKYQREVNGYTQKQVAMATGVSQPKLSYYESGRHLPLIDDCIRLADFY